MAQLSPYLQFSDKCREAMSFYQACFGGELNIQTVGESPIAAEMPPEAHGTVLHSQLTARNGLILMASGMTGQDEVHQGNNVHLCLACDSEEEITTLFSRLSTGGSVHHPLEKSFWGATFGEVTDKFGIHWMLNFDRNSQV